MLFEQVCKQLNLLETDYFGLEYTDNRGSTYWLDRDKPMNQQVIVQPICSNMLQYATQYKRMYYMANKGGDAWRCWPSAPLYGEVLHARPQSTGGGVHQV